MASASAVPATMLGGPDHFNYLRLAKVDQQRLNHDHAPAAENGELKGNPQAFFPIRLDSNANERAEASPLKAIRR